MWQIDFEVRTKITNDYYIHHTMEALNESQLDAVAQFKLITGVEDRESDVLSLLAVNNYDLNSSVSNFFDSGFDSVGRTPVVEPPATTTGAEFHDAAGLHTRAREIPQLVNLQSQFIESRRLPRLPKAPKINNSWTFEVGIHCSIRDSQKLEKNNQLVVEPKRVRPLAYLWIILLFIPKNLLHFILSAIRYLSATRHEDPNLFPSQFDFDKFDPDYDILAVLSKQLSKKSASIESDDSTKNESDSQSEYKTEDESTLQQGSISPSGTEIESTEKRSIEDHFDQTNNYNISTYDFNSLHESSQRNYLWLLVILVNDSPQSIQFARDLLASSLFDKLFNKLTGEYKETLIYLNNVDTNREAFEVGQTYAVKRTPYVMLLGNVTNSPAVMHSMSILYKSHLPHSFISVPELSQSAAKKVSKNLHKLIDTFHPQLVSSRYDQQEIEFARSIKQQQDNAYEESLERDRLKKLQKESELEQQQQSEHAVRVKKYKLSQLLNSDFRSSITSSTNNVRVAIKLPSGKRVIESLSKDISVNHLYLYIEMLLEAENLRGEQAEEQDIDEISNEEYISRFPFSFEVFQPMPKMVIEPSEAEVGGVHELRSGANLLVEYIVEEDDEEED